MIKNYEKIIKKFTGAKGVYEIEVIQSLWSGYGKIIRFGVDKCRVNTVIVKHVQMPKGRNIPKEGNGALSYKRKLKSYKVETAWYKQWSNWCNDLCYVPKCFGIETHGEDVFIVLEDLEESGYSIIKKTITFEDMKLCITWLANFHATFLGTKPESLWNIGTYWHLDTRPYELNVIEDEELKKFAYKIDLELKKSPYKTFVHGDAKLANFCFSKDEKSVSAVDFQYVGGGCGMKDLAYLVNSCLNEGESESMEGIILDYYFEELQKALSQKNLDKSINVQALEGNWRYLYPVALADFHRFLKGWSSEFFEKDSYSERVTRQVIESLRNK